MLNKFHDRADKRSGVHFISTFGTGSGELYMLSRGLLMQLLEAMHVCYILLKEICTAARRP